MTAPKPLTSTLDLIGNTPLVLLKGPSEAAGCEIWGKCEFANPGASVKDRAALWIIRDAERNGTLLRRYRVAELWQPWGDGVRTQPLSTGPL